MKLTIWPFFLLMIIIQWIVPLQMIWDKEVVLRTGKTYKFRTVPVDPIDPFIGKYITLNFREQSFELKSQMRPTLEQPVYVTFQNNKEGFAEIKNIMTNPPADNDYLKTKINRVDAEQGKVIVFIDYPFTRFYMEESKAPQAETIYGDELADSSSRVYALVSLHKGGAVIKDVYVNDSTIKDVLNARANIREEKP